MPAIETDRACRIGQRLHDGRSGQLHRRILRWADDRSPTFWQECDGATRGLLPLLLSFVRESFCSRVGMVTVQEVVTAIQETGRHAWITDFESKYALYITQA